MKTNLMNEMRPTMFITKNKQRLKQFNGTVFLKNGEEFEIELFNGTQDKVLAKIEINNKSLGNKGIVLRPGERIFLDRHLNVQKKFIFETYMINGNDKNSMTAIEKNGDVVVKFYKEYIPTNYYVNYPSPITYATNYPIEFTTTCSTISYYSTSDKLENIETGRIDVGSVSNQTFINDNSNFDYSYSWISQWKILPESRKVLTSEDLTLYCTKCGTKRKKTTYKFCPTCGTKF